MFQSERTTRPQLHRIEIRGHERSPTPRAFDTNAAGRLLPRPYTRQRRTPANDVTMFLHAPDRAKRLRRVLIPPPCSRASLTQGGSSDAPRSPRRSRRDFLSLSLSLRRVLGSRAPPKLEMIGSRGRPTSARGLRPRRATCHVPHIHTHTSTLWGAEGPALPAVSPTCKGPPASTKLHPSGLGLPCEEGECRGSSTYASAGFDARALRTGRHHRKWRRRDQEKGRGGGRESRHPRQGLLLGLAAFVCARARVCVFVFVFWTFRRV